MISADLIPLLVATPMAAGVLTTLLRGWIPAQRFVGAVSLALTITMAAYWMIQTQTTPTFVTQSGGWKAPFGISIVFDGLSGMLIIAANIVAAACFIHSFGSISRRHERGWFHPLFHMMLMGINFSFLTGDLFNLFVAFEIVLMSSYALICLGGSRQQLTQAYKYVMLNLIGSTFFVLGAGLVYGMMGTLNLADLARIVAETQANGEALPPGFFAVGLMLLFVFSLKAAVFPLWFWLPDTYHTCPIAIAAMFGGLLTKVGVYTLMRVFPMIFIATEIRTESILTTVLMAGAGATMLLAILGAVAMRNIRRLLALVLVSHIGYLVFGVAVMTDASLAGSLFYMVQHMLVMAGLFLCCGVIEKIGGTDDLKNLGGLHQKAPWLSVLFFVCAIALAGLPPLPGFYGKLTIIREGFTIDRPGAWMLSVIAMITSVLTLMAMAKVWALTFWMPPREDAEESPQIGHRPPRQFETAPAYVGVVMLTSAAILMAVFAPAIMRKAESSVISLNDPEPYVAAVLGEEAWPTTEFAGELEHTTHSLVHEEDHYE